MNLVICIDGTWENAEGSNIHRIFGYAAEGDRQKKFYCPGPGTRFGSYLLGGLICADAKVILGECRRFIADNHREWCDLYVFGFSRGAFLARVLCDMANRAGITVRFLGCIDTVCATPFYDAAEFASTPPNVMVARHAVAINESRRLFAAVPMRGRGVREEFFAGCHGDVGGTFTDNRVLGDIVLKWLLGAAGRSGMGLTAAAAEWMAEKCDYAAALPHDSLSGPAIRRRICRSRLHSSVCKLPFAVFRKVKNAIEALRSDEITASPSSRSS